MQNYDALATDAKLRRLDMQNYDTSTVDAKSRAPACKIMTSQLLIQNYDAGAAKLRSPSDRRKITTPGT